jgi:hypothetical protein
LEPTQLFDETYSRINAVIPVVGHGMLNKTGVISLTKFETKFCGIKDGVGEAKIPLNLKLPDFVTFDT